MMRLAAQLQQHCQFNQSTLGTFIQKNNLSPEEVTMLQSEFISNVVTMFSAQQAATRLLGSAPPQVSKTVLALDKYAVPTLATLSAEDVRVVLTRGPVFLAGSRQPLWYAGLDEYHRPLFHYEGEQSEDALNIHLSQLYFFPYDPTAKERVVPGKDVWHFYPGDGLNVIHLDQIVHNDTGTGLLQMQSGKLIPPAYVTSIPEQG